MSFTPFSLSEEAFLLKSLSEVTKVWASATGKATFNFSVQDGQAHLQLGFQLGRPGNHHLPPQPPGSNKTKTSFRKERDRLRAAEHQARKEVVPTTVPKTSTNPEASTTAASAVTSMTLPKVAVPVTPPSIVSLSPGIPVKEPSTTQSPEAVPALSTVSTTAAASAAPLTHPPIYPCRPIRPFCEPDKNEPLKELPYFIENLRRQVYFSDDKESKVKHKAIVKAFAEEVKKEPNILFKSKNYEETFLLHCPESQRHYYVSIFGT